MPIIHSIPNQTNIKNNLHLRNLADLVVPINGRGSQSKTPEHTQVCLKRKLPAYLPNHYLNETIVR
jgi:hypothetical protein